MGFASPEVALVLLRSAANSSLCSFKAGELLLKDSDIIFLKLCKAASRQTGCQTSLLKHLVLTLYWTQLRQRSVCRQSITAQTIPVRQDLALPTPSALETVAALLHMPRSYARPQEAQLRMRQI